MIDDLAFLHEHLDGFPEYGDEHARNGSDMRVRSFVGLALTDVQERSGADLDASQRGELDTLLFRSQFSDNAYLKKLGHSDLGLTELAALAREDRKLIEIATRLGGSAAADLPGVFSELGAQFEARHLPFVK